MTIIRHRLKRLAFACLAAGTIAATPALAQQLESVDPDTAFGEGIDADLVAPTVEAQTPAPAERAATESAPVETPPSPSIDSWTEQDVGTPAVSADTASEPAATTTAQAESTTYSEDDLIGEAEGLFGKGAEGLAKLIQGLLKDQGEPNAYIVGREAGGAFAIGVRYGSGKLHHKVEGERKVYWTGPSIGFDVGANAANTFVLVYNLYDTEELYERYPAGEGQAYVVGGLTASYLRKGDVVLIPIRMGAGLRLGVNAGYMKFSKKQRWLPF